MKNVVTSDLKDFSPKETMFAGDLMRAFKNVKDQTGIFRAFFHDHGVKVAKNKNSGYIFLTNSEYQSAMFGSWGKIDLWLFTPYSGFEGFYCDLIDDHLYDMELDDLEYMRDLAESIDDVDTIERINELIKEMEG